MSVRTRTYLKARFESGDVPTAQDFIDLFDTMRMWSEAVPVSSVTYGWLALSVQPSGAISWDVSLGGNAYVTLNNATCALTITNAVPGQVLMLKVKQDATGGRAMTLPAGSKVGYGGAGIIALSSAANAIDIVTCIVDEAGAFLWLVNQNFS